MLMVVFGAGASYDSNPYKPALLSPNDYNRMPLADGLFSDRPLFRDILALFPKCAPIVARLLPQGSEFSIERELQRLLDDGISDPKRHQQLAAVRYYLHTMIPRCQGPWLAEARGSTNHAALLDHLRRKEADGICLVTFNYDTIIEDALRSVGVQINELPSYISNDHYKLIKLHGSVNWAHPIASGFNLPTSTAPDKARSWIIDNINSLQVDSIKFEIVNEIPMSFREEEFHVLLRRARPQIESVIESRLIGLFPAIAIPVEKKNTFECPADHVQALESCLPEVDRVIVVGWRATEMPFLKLLADKLGTQRGKPKCLVVAEKPESTRMTVANLEQAGVKADYTHYVAGFTGFITSTEAEKFLAY